MSDEVMTTPTLKETLRRELPDLLRNDPDLRAYILELTRHDYAGRADTQDRFYELLAELRRDREKQDLKWEEQNRKWEANQAELRRDREKQELKWEEQNRKWEANQAELRRDREKQDLKWEEQNRKWEANQAQLCRDREKQDLKWEANQAELQRLHEQNMALAKKHDRSIGALGARWGMQSERAFRDALAGILEQNFGVEVINVIEYDDQGEVFGRPDQIELDVIIKNGLLLICELKSSIDKAGMYIFERKARFYERHHQRTADRLIVISPMIDSRARQVAQRLGIQTYGDSIEVEAL